MTEPEPCPRCAELEAQRDLARGMALDAVGTATRALEERDAARVETERIRANLARAYAQLARRGRR